LSGCYDHRCGHFHNDAADARHSRTTYARHHQEAGESYNPAFSSIMETQLRRHALRHQSEPSRHPASLTKIMTLYLLFERLDAGKMKLDTEMDVSSTPDQAPTKLVWPGSNHRCRRRHKGLVTAPPTTLPS